MQSLETVDTKEVDQVAYTQYMEEQREADANEIRRELVRDLLKKLPESERTVMTLHYLGEMTCESISEFLGVSPNTIRSRLSRARNRLKKEEAMIKENLSSFQLPTQMTENIMKEISRLNPVAPSGSKPLVPLAVSAASAVLVLLLIGLGTQRLKDFQKPYNLNAQSERMIEISEAQLVVDSPEKPAVRNKVGNTDLTGESNGVGQKPDDPLFAAANADETEVSKAKPQWVQTKGPEGGSVPGLFTTTRGDVYAGTRQGLYRLTDDRSAWKLVNNIKGPLQISIFERTKWWPVAERQDTLYLATLYEILASTDRGETWKPLCESINRLPVDMVITDGIPGARSDMTIYLLAHGNGIFRTDDAGKSWIRLTKGLRNKNIRAITAIENTVFAGTDQGLYRLNSDTWEQLPIDHENTQEKTVEYIYALAAAENRLYVMAKKHLDSSYRIEVTPAPSDASSDWIELANIVDNPYHWSFGTLFLYRSTDQGNSWKSITPKLGDTGQEFLQDEPVLILSRNKEGNVIHGVNGVHEVGMRASRRLIASGKNVMLINGNDDYYSNDTGETWTSLNNVDEMGNASAAVMVDANTFYRNGTRGIHRTTDSGESWHEFNFGLVNTNVKHLIAENGVLYANTETGLVNSTDGGESWRHVMGDTDYLTFIGESNGNFYAKDNKMGTPRLFQISDEENRLIHISKIPAFPKSNSHQNLIPKESFQNLIPKEPYQNWISEESYVVVTQGDELFLRSDLGNFVVTDTVYYVEYQHKLFRWNVGTLNWYNTGVAEMDEVTRREYHSNVLDPKGFRFAVSGKTVYAGKRNGHLMQSFDEGNRWKDISANLPFSVERFNAITFVGQSVYIATDKGVVKSSNGTDWQTLTDIEGTPLVMNRLAVDTTTVYGEYEQKIYQLNRNTGTWQQVTPEIPYPVTCLDVDGNMLYVGTFGSGVLRFSLDE